MRDDVFRATASDDDVAIVLNQTPGKVCLAGKVPIGEEEEDTLDGKQVIEPIESAV